MKLKEAQSELDMYSSEISSLEFSERKQHQTSHQLLDNDHKKISNELTMKKMQSSHVSETLIEISSMSKSDMLKKTLQHGDKMLHHRAVIGNNVLFMLKQGNMFVGDINDDIKEQNQRMMDMEEVVKDSQSSLKRVNELVGFFAKAFYKDMILKILIILIAVAIIAVVIASVAKKKPVTANSAIPANSTNPNTNPTPVRLLMENRLWVDNSYTPNTQLFEGSGTKSRRKRMFHH